MAFRTSAVHWEIIIAFMEKNKDLAKGFLNGASGKDTTKKLWEELTTQLNSAGFGEKSTIKWQKTWTDFKHLLKKKAAGIKVEINGTGGGPSQLKGLSDIENRILYILGPSFYKGVGRPENGCSFGASTEPNSNLNITKCNEVTVSNTNFNDIQTSTQKDSTSNKNISSQEHMNFETHTNVQVANSSTNQQTPRIEEVVFKRRLQDHDYLKTPMRSPKRFKSKSSEEPMEAMYKETLNELIQIKGCLQDLTNCGKGIQNAIEKIASHICNKD